MTKTKYPRSLAKYVRKQKAAIRRKTDDKEEQERLIRGVINTLDESRKTK